MRLYKILLFEELQSLFSCNIHQHYPNFFHYPYLNKKNIKICLPLYINKKSILQYAIEGKLVKQDPNNKPASFLLERTKVSSIKVMIKIVILIIITL